MSAKLRIAGGLRSGRSAESNGSPSETCFSFYPVVYSPETQQAAVLAGAYADVADTGY